MPALENTRHEAYAQARAKGRTMDQAYIEAGFAPNKGNAARLNTNDRIKARIAELTKMAAERAVEVISFEAKAQFERIQAIVTKALEAGDFKTALAGQQFIAKCFGYEDNPTLTHEHVLGRKLPQVAPSNRDDDQDGPKKPIPGDVASAMAEALDSLRRGDRPN